MPVIEAFDTRAGWAEACAARLAETLGAAVQDGGRAIFAGAGGSTPSPIYRDLSSVDLDWSRVTVTLVDERYVPESDDQSNARLMKQTLMTGPASAATFLPLYRSEVTVDRAAILAAHDLAQISARAGGRLDAVLLGMGEDGHICSMFPESPTLKTLLTPTLKPTVLGVPAGRDDLPPSLERLSINLPYLAQAGRVILALTGRTKREVFERELDGDPIVTPIAALVAAQVPLEVLWTEAA